MSNPDSASFMQGDAATSRNLWIFLPAITMSLGWGLRGYIGGGPFGAMIAGALVALIICQLLRMRAERVAVLLAFAAVGVGFGGNMTYGQTIGFLRDTPTIYWGLLGLTLKGAIWGLLGGAVLGLGFLAETMDRKRLILAFACFLAACFLGLALINEPKLIYFSNRLDKPRGESWAGLLFGALALLAYLSAVEKERAFIPRRFAWYGFIAGGIGFGGGALWMVIGTHVETLKWLPWWKFMEFSFGGCFGAGLGWAAWALRNELNALTPPTEEQESPTNFVMALLIGIVCIAVVFLLWPYLGFKIGRALRELPGQFVVAPFRDAFLGYTGVGCLLMLLAQRSRPLAWHIAVAVTFIATAVDLQADWGPEGKLEIAESLRKAFVLVTGAAALVLTARWVAQADKDLRKVFLGLMWALMAIAYAKGISDTRLWHPVAEEVASAGGRAAFLYTAFRSEIIVHAIFTTLALLATFWRPPAQDTLDRSA